eukprot:2294265-Prymnesium_polylepis.1
MCEASSAKSRHELKILRDWALIIPATAACSSRFCCNTSSRTSLHVASAALTPRLVRLFAAPRSFAISCCFSATASRHAISNLSRSPYLRRRPALVRAFGRLAHPLQPTQRPSMSMPDAARRPARPRPRIGHGFGEDRGYKRREYTARGGTRRCTENI